jgi:hypothetical protein
MISPLQGIKIDGENPDYTIIDFGIGCYLDLST